MFRSLYRHGFARVAACVGRSHIADPEANAAEIRRLAEQCDADGVAVAVFPELCLSAYALEDLLLQETLLERVEAALLANYAGGVVVMKMGTATVSREELREAIRSDPKPRLEARWASS